MAASVIRPDSRVLRTRSDNTAAALSALKSIRKDTEKQKKNISSALTALEEKQVSSLLSAMDVEELNRAKRGIRVSALRSAGINDLEQVYRRSRGSLESIEGIGEQSARTIYTTVRSIADTIRISLRVKLTVEDESEEFAALLPLLYRYILTDSARKSAEKLTESYADAAENALAAAKKGSGAIKWLFLSAGDRQAAADAAQELERLEDVGFPAAARELWADYAAVPVPELAEARRAFEINTALFAVTVEQLGRGVAQETGWSGVPAELAEKVNARPLDLRYLKATLRSYQEFGTKYILCQKRTLLGDEMGLGKTVQAIAAMAALKAEGGEKFLVVCPASVLVNWCREVEQHCELPVGEIHGSDRGDELRRWISSGTVAVTTYETAARLTLPPDLRIDMLVADEAHYVKNPGTIRTQALLGLAARSENVLYMTGTPLENRVDEMCYLMSTLQPETAKAAEGLKYISNAPAFREAVAPVYLRRCRDDVLTELPEKIEQDQWLRPTEEDRKEYILSVMSKNFMAMRRVSWDVRDLSRSSKAQRLLEILDEARGEGRKVIVFSYFLATAEKVRALAGDNVFGPIDGSVPAARRQETVDAFTAAPPGAVLVSQITAGGTGLNIQAASVVVFCEPQIKPSLETQAVSRAYRMGQARSVLVYRLLCTGTVDEDIVALLRDKQEQFDSFAHESAVGSESILAQSMSEWMNKVIEEQTEKLT